MCMDSIDQKNSKVRRKEGGQKKHTFEEEEEERKRSQKYVEEKLSWRNQRRSWCVHRPNCSIAENQKEAE
jgi:hypothetical protein